MRTTVNCPGEGRNKVMLLVAALLVFASIWLPYWQIHIVAPQYPKGLNVIVYVTGAGGDVREVDGLNHYIGMRPLGEAAPFERKISIPGLSAIALALLLLMLLPRPRWLQILLALPVWAVPFVFAGDLYYWLREYGLNLDPKAPLSAMIKPFIPPLIGPGKVGQFQVYAWFHIGYFIVLIAGVLTFVAVYRRLTCKQLQQAVPAVTRVATTVAFLLVMGLALYGQEQTTWVVGPQSGLSLQQAIRQARPGDTIRVIGGEHRGNFIVDKTLTLVGEGSPVLNGEGRGSVIRLKAPRCVLRGFVIRNSGIVLSTQDSGVQVSAPDCIVENNRLEKVLFGVHLQRAHRTIIRHNKIYSHHLPVARRGDQIRIWYSHHTRVEANQVVGGRDLVFWYSEGLIIRNNRVRNCRYGVHFMYCNDSLVEGNDLEGNSVGVYVMYSEGVQVRANQILRSRGPSGMGLGVKDGYRLQIERNLIAGNRTGLFIDSGEGVYRENWFIRNDVGIHLVLAVKPNLFQGNRMVENIEQVQMDRADSVAGVRWAGNFWSDYSGYDADGDGIGEVPYRAMKVFDQIAASNSALRLLTYSPSAQALDFGARLFPLFAPQTMVTDEKPLTRAGTPPSLPFEQPFPMRSRWLLTALGLLMAGVLSMQAPKSSRQGRHLRLQKLIQLSKRSDKSAKSEMKPMVIRVERLTRRFGTLTAVDNLSFIVREGETLALWGANGAGKTTILRCLLGLLRFEGEAQILGHSVKREGVIVRQQVGYVPQLVSLHSDLSVQETVSFYAQLRGVPMERADALLNEWELQAHREKPISALSGGMKQKLALVLALLSDPPVLLLDEPTAHLDAASRAEWLELLRRLKAQGKTLLFCTHQLNEVRALADRVIVLERGRKVAELTGAQFTRLWQQHGSLRLSVPPDQVEQAHRVLQEAGYDPESTDGLILVRHLEAKQVEPLRLLLQAGVEVLDYEWRPPSEPPDWTLLDEATRFMALTSSPTSDAHPNTPTKGEGSPLLANSEAWGRWGRVYLLVSKEVRDARRNRWFLMLMGIFVALSLLLTLFGLTGMGQSGASGFGRTFASLLNLSLLIVPLMGLLLGALSIAVERDQQTLHTLLAQPLTPATLVFGKFLGTMLTLGAAVLIGFGSSGLIIYMSGANVPLAPFLGQLGLTLLLGWSCLALGLLVSVLVKRGPTAVGVALLLWLFLTFISDLGIIGTAIALQLRASTLLWLTLLNPLQVFKVAVIQLMEGNLEVLGSAGLYARDVLGDAVLPILSGILVAWVAVPFLLALGWFTRRGAIE
ncbi:putative ABC transporter ATP-binding protein YxlF [bacterium HR15]|nr:putative ABC transporter ATP-binding protein YxlF [bacterium HR15]